MHWQFIWCTQGACALALIRAVALLARIPFMGVSSGRFRVHRAVLSRVAVDLVALAVRAAILAHKAPPFVNMRPCCRFIVYERFEFVVLCVRILCFFILRARRKGWGVETRSHIHV